MRRLSSVAVAVLFASVATAGASTVHVTSAHATSVTSMTGPPGSGKFGS